MDLGFKGKVALVTGAGSQIGFGKAIALLLAKEGCDALAVNDINLDDAKKTADAMKALGRKAIAIKADVTKKGEVQAMVNKTVAEFKKIDILANVAGAILGAGPFDKQAEELWDKEIALNFKGTLLVTQAVLPGMVERKYGKIINISSGSVRAAFGVSTYTIAKGAVEIFTRHLAKSVIKDGVNVNCVSPGWALTNFIKGDKEEARKRFLPGTPIGRGTTPEDIAYAVAFFASDISGDIVGQVLDVTGGSTL
jgi:NAD(P)-dependent dehydrogenase (short-subunit alcohol dehydrogenase family)